MSHMPMLSLDERERVHFLPASADGDLEERERVHVSASRGCATTAYAPTMLISELEGGGA